MKKTTQLLLSVAFGASLYVGMIVLSILFGDGIVIYLVAIFGAAISAGAGAGLFALITFYRELQKQDEKDEDARLKKLKADYDHYFGGKE